MSTLDLKDAYLSVPVHKDSPKLLHFFWRDKFYAFQGLCFGLNTTPRVFYQTLKTGSSTPVQTGCPYDPRPRRLPYLGFALPGSTERDSYRYSSLSKPRFHSKSGKVMPHPNATNNISGFCNRLLP